MLCNFIKYNAHYELPNCIFIVSFYGIFAVIKSKVN